VVLSKPMSRWTVFLGKYVGALSFILVQTVYFVLVTLVVIRMHTGTWIWGYLWAIPLLLAMFSYLYCVSALAGLWTRSSVGALLVTLIFWVVIYGFAQGDAVFVMQRYEAAKKGREQPPSAAMALVHRVSSVLPRTQDITLLVADKMNALSVKQFAETFAKMDENAASPDILDEIVKVPSMARSVGTSLAFEAVVVLIAGYVFTRRDY
jgi:hypothetical protein